MYCKYKDFFGEVNTGIHSYRVFNIAIMDVIFTFLAAFIISLVIPKYNYFIILFFLFLSCIILHHMFCVKTTIDKLLFD